MVTIRETDAITAARAEIEKASGPMLKHHARVAADKQQLATIARELPIADANEQFAVVESLRAKRAEIELRLKDAEKTSTEHHARLMAAEKALAAAQMDPLREALAAEAANIRRMTSELHAAVHRLEGSRGFAAQCAAKVGIVNRQDPAHPWQVVRVGALAAQVYKLLGGITITPDDVPSAPVGAGLASSYGR